MGASYVERLLWRYLKNNVFGGFKAFIKVEAIPHVLFVVFALGYLFYYETGLLGIIFSSLFMCILGLALRRRELKISESLVIVVLSIILFLLPIYIITDIDTIISAEYLRYFAIAIVVVWTIFNISMFIVQTGDMFASTGGLLLLWGSDEDHAFLSPLVILAFVGSVAYAFWRLDYILASLVSIPILIFILYTYVIFRGKGRIVRSAYAISTLLAVYVVVSNVASLGVISNTIFWFFVTVISTLFTAQSHARAHSLEKDIVKYSIISILGLTLALVAVIMPAPQSLLSLSEWQVFTIVGVVPAPILAHVYLRTMGKLDYYIERNKFNLATIIKEISIALGVKLLEQLKNQVIGQITSLFKM